LGREITNRFKGLTFTKHQNNISNIINKGKHHLSFESIEDIAINVVATADDFVNYHNGLKCTSSLKRMCIDIKLENYRLFQLIDYQNCQIITLEKGIIRLREKLNEKYLMNESSTYVFNSNTITGFNLLSIINNY